MHSIRAARSQRFHASLGLAALALLIGVAACGNTGKDSPAVSASGGTADVAVGGAKAGSAGRAPSNEGGAAGDVDASAGAAGEAGAAGAGSAPSEAFTCLPGGTSFVAGNYTDHMGTDLLLRVNSKLATLAIVATGVANPGKPPHLYLVERACAPGAAAVLRDETGYFRLDYRQLGSGLALCLAPAPTLKDALWLAPADVSHAADAGCAGKPFQFFTQGTL
jgi:hypothetical protein